MNQRKIAASSGVPTRVQGVTGDTTVKATAGIVEFLCIANVNAAVQTLTLKDGGTTKHVFRVAAGGELVVPLMWKHGTSIVVNPSHADIDAFIGWS